MQMNPEKTVIWELAARTCTMEPLLGCKELTLRKRKAAAAAAAFCSLNKLWLRNLPVSIEMKMKIYNGTVLQHFLHGGDAIVDRFR
jgi:hypothetical protein